MIRSIQKNLLDKKLIIAFAVLFFLIQLEMPQAGNVPEQKPQGNPPAQDSNQQVNSAYPFKPGDGVFISTLPDSLGYLNKAFPIDDQGYVDFPIIGKVKVTRMTEQELVDFIKENYKE